MQGSVLHRCSVAECRTVLKGARLKHARRVPGSHDEWLCSSCRSKGKPRGQHRAGFEAQLHGIVPSRSQRQNLPNDAATRAEDMAQVHSPLDALGTAAPAAGLDTHPRFDPMPLPGFPVVPASAAPAAASAPAAAVIAGPARSPQLLPLFRGDSSPAFYDRYHYVLQPSCERAHGIAQDLEAAKLKDASLSILLSGNVQQLDIGAMAAKQSMKSELLARLVALAVETTEKYTRVPARRLRVMSIKLLTSKHGEGEQLIHCDHVSGFACRGRYSFLLYLSDGAPSTAMWKHPHAHLPKLDNDDKTDPQSLRHESLYARVWNKQEYHSLTTVARGQSMLFDEAQPHYGVTNTSLHARRVAFVQLADTDVASAELLLDGDAAADSDEYQFYEWQHAELAWGENSRQFAEALVKNKEYDPLQLKFPLDMAREAARTLRHTGLFAAYFGSEVEPSWLAEPQENRQVAPRRAHRPKRPAAAAEESNGERKKRRHGLQ